MAIASQTRPRAGGSRLFIIVGAVLALLAFLLVLLLGGIGGKGGVGGATVPVVAAARDIPLRAALGKDDVVIKQVAQSDVPPQAYNKLDDITKAGYIAALSIVKGQPITTNMLAKSGDLVTGAQPAFLPIPTGFVAVTIPTNELQGVAGFIQSGDYINVIATAPSSVFQTSGNPAGGTPKSVSITVFTNLHVLRLGIFQGNVQPAGSSAPASSSGTAAGVPSSITVVVTECDAQYLNWLATNASLKYTLGSYKDYKPQDTQPDPACPNAQAARPVGPAQVDARWGFTRP